MHSLAARPGTSQDAPEDGDAVALAAAAAIAAIRRAADHVAALAAAGPSPLHARALLQFTSAEEAVRQLQAATERAARRRRKAALIAELALAAYLEDRRGGLHSV